MILRCQNENCIYFKKLKNNPNINYGKCIKAEVYLTLLDDESYESSGLNVACMHSGQERTYVYSKEA